MLANHALIFIKIFLKILISLSNFDMQSELKRENVINLRLTVLACAMTLEFSFSQSLVMCTVVVFSSSVGTSRYTNLKTSWLILLLTQ